MLQSNSPGELLQQRNQDYLLLEKRYLQLKQEKFDECMEAIQILRRHEQELDNNIDCVIKEQRSIETFFEEAREEFGNEVKAINDIMIEQHEKSRDREEQLKTLEEQCADLELQEEADWRSIENFEGEVGEMQQELCEKDALVKLRILRENNLLGQLENLRSENAEIKEQIVGLSSRLSDEAELKKQIESSRERNDELNEKQSEIEELTEEEREHFEVYEELQNEYEQLQGENKKYEVEIIRLKELLGNYTNEELSQQISEELKQMSLIKEENLALKQTNQEQELELSEVGEIIKDVEKKEEEICFLEYEVLFDKKLNQLTEELNYNSECIDKCESFVAQISASMQFEYSQLEEMIKELSSLQCSRGNSLFSAIVEEEEILSRDLFKSMTYLHNIEKISQQARELCRYPMCDNDSANNDATIIQLSEQLEKEETELDKQKLLLLKATDDNHKLTFSNAELQDELAEKQEEFTTLHKSQFSGTDELKQDIHKMEEQLDATKGELEKQSENFLALKNQLQQEKFSQLAVTTFNYELTSASQVLNEYALALNCNNAAQSNKCEQELEVILERMQEAFNSVERQDWFEDFTASEESVLFSSLPKEVQELAISNFAEKEEIVCEAHQLRADERNTQVCSLLEEEVIDCSLVIRKIDCLLLETRDKPEETQYQKLMQQISDLNFSIQVLKQKQIEKEKEYIEEEEQNEKIIENYKKQLETSKQESNILQSNLSITEAELRNSQTADKIIPEEALSEKIEKLKQDNIILNENITKLRLEHKNEKQELLNQIQAQKQEIQSLSFENSALSEINMLHSQNDGNIEYNTAELECKE